MRFPNEIWLVRLMCRYVCMFASALLDKDESISKACQVRRRGCTKFTMWLDRLFDANVPTHEYITSCVVMDEVRGKVS